MAIRLMRAADVPETPRDRVYRASRLHAVVVVLACLAGCGAMLWNRWPTAHLSYYISGVIILLLLALRHLVTARFHPLNWLVRLGDEGLFIHFRSYLNDHLSADDPTVAFIPFGDIRSARLVREWVTTPNVGNRSETQLIRSVEFDLVADAAVLESAISTECGRSAVPEKRWYGTSSTLYRDYPAQIEAGSVLRLRWQVVPGPSSFLKAIRQRVPIAETVVLREDFSRLQGLPRAQQDDRLRHLIQRGQTNAAVYMVRRLHSFDLTRAVDYVQALGGATRS